MLGPLLATKFHIPPAPADWVPRPHLLQTLDAAMKHSLGIDRLVEN
jgi:ATP/maltotriose-dependent transcriptional regulator MalT